MITYTNRQINSGAQVRKARQRSTMGKIFWEIHREYARVPSRTDCQGGGGEAQQPLGMGVLRQFSL